MKVKNGPGEVSAVRISGSIGVNNGVDEIGQDNLDIVFKKDKNAFFFELAALEKMVEALAEIAID